MDLRSLSCVFMGYSPDHVGFLCFHLPTDQTCNSKDILFNKEIFSFQTPREPIPSAPSAVFAQPILPLVSPYIRLTPGQHSSLFSSPIPSSSRPESPTCDPLCSLDSTSSPTPSSRVSSSPFAPCVSLSLPSVPLPSSPIYTRSKSNIFCPKQCTNGTIVWNPPKISLSLFEVPSFSSIPEEPQHFLEASRYPSGVTP